MSVTFWGVRGSIPTPLTPLEIEAKVIEMSSEVVRAGVTNPDEVASFLRNKYTLMECGTVGGNTTCVSVEWEDTTVIFDAGTGIRPLGKKLMKGPFSNGGSEVHLLVTHTHWDHIMGFPYFAPLFQRNTINIHGVHPNLEDRFRGQQKPEYYPVPLEIFPATLNFDQIEENKKYELKGGGSFSAMKLHHPGDCFGYRVERNGVSVIMATDSEYKRGDDGLIARTIEFFKGADLLIFDSQYTVEEALLKEDWGHSSAIMGVRLAIEAGVKKLALFHHEPNYSDKFICNILKKALSDKDKHHPGASLDVFAATEGLQIDL
ncbi:MAG: MBL fold metallo-hydrolase [Candidatus Electryonea clarkiae]|nr:MBL fold metallo-hydrolase [Candidatus Electryonea clarkiae]MDP8289215.1 MBL fold metallo-hydrolase [Candidatus Electryonea clarkiae]